MKQIWTILKIIGGWIIGIFAIIFGLFSFFETTFWVSKIFASLLTLTGLYIIPLINKKLNIGLKPLIISIIFLVSFLGIPISETFQKPDNSIETEEYYVTANVLNVREEQGTDSKVLFKLKKGDKVDVISEENNWTKITISDGQTGYVSSEFISDKPQDKKGDDNWLTYIVIGIIVVIGMFSKGSSGTSSAPTKSTKSVNKQEIRPYFLTVNNGVVYLGQEKSTMKTPVYQTITKAVDCDLENNTDNRSRFLVVTTEGNVQLCQLGSTGRKEVFRNFVSYGKAYRARFASSDSFYFDTDKGKYKGYFNSTRKDKL